MRRMMRVLIAVGLTAGSVIATAGVSDAATSDVCPGDTVEVSGEQTSITITAPAGSLISGYCVKAGSAKQGLGPETTVLSEPQASVTLTHTSGKGISHYSITFVPDSGPTS